MPYLIASAAIVAIATTAAKVAVTFSSEYATVADLFDAIVKAVV